MRCCSKTHKIPFVSFHSAGLCARCLVDVFVVKPLFLLFLCLFRKTEWNKKKRWILREREAFTRGTKTGFSCTSARLMYSCVLVCSCNVVNNRAPLCIHTWDLTLHLRHFDEWLITPRELKSQPRGESAAQIGSVWLCSAVSHLLQLMDSFKNKLFSRSVDCTFELVREPMATVLWLSRNGLQDDKNLSFTRYMVNLNTL